MQAPARGSRVDLVEVRNPAGSSAAASCDNITTIPVGALGEQIGGLLDRQEQALSDAIHAAFDLD